MTTFFEKLISPSRWAAFVLAVVATAGSLLAQAPLRGVNIAGAEFGEGTIPGDYNTHYTFNSEPTFAYFAANELPLLRVPIRWERIQRVPFGPLDADYLDRLRRNVAWAKAHGARVLIDVHNYGRYKLDEGGFRVEYVLDNRYSGVIKVSSDALVDLWQRLSDEFRDELGVQGYGLMNEPHDMGQADWKAISQKTLAAIRARGDHKKIYVGGDSWSSAERWPQIHGNTSWINDPVNNFVYEAHLYFDHDASGRYFQGYDQELAANPNLPQIGRMRLQPFWDWCRSNNVPCFVGEYGIPGADPRWRAVLANLLAAMDEAGMSGTYWAAGDWWGDYPLSVHPQGGQDRPQLAVLKEYAGPAFAATVSAASSKLGAQAPGSLVSVYGAALAATTESAMDLPLPAELGGARAEILPAGGEAKAVGLVFVSPGQINCLLPEDLPEGPAELRFYRDGRMVAVDDLQVAAVTPGLFAANGRGTGAPAGQILRLAADGTSDVELLADYDQASMSYSPRPIRFSGPDERIFLILYGTGFARAEAAGDARILFDGEPGRELTYIGEQREFPGLDQVNLELSREAVGSGAVTVELEVGGRRSNQLVVFIE